jgi:hypothetical protein
MGDYPFHRINSLTAGFSTQMSTWDDNKGSQASVRMTQDEQRPSQDLGESDFAADIDDGHQGHQVSLS